MGANDYVSYDLALALTKAGFDEPCIAQWACEPDGKPMLIGSTAFVFRNTDLKGRDVVAPFLWQAQKWLREAKDIYVYPEINALKKWFARAVDMKRNEDLLFDGAMFDTHEEAQSYAISYALQLLDNGKTMTI